MRSEVRKTVENPDRVRIPVSVRHDAVACVWLVPSHPHSPPDVSIAIELGNKNVRVTLRGKVVAPKISSSGKVPGDIHIVGLVQSNALSPGVAIASHAHRPLDRPVAVQLGDKDVG